jgi:hypothetical protein
MFRSEVFLCYFALLKKIQGQLVNFDLAMLGVLERLLNSVFLGAFRLP